MKEQILLKEEVFKVVGCAFEVMKHVGHGFNEKTYENALTYEMELQKIPYDQQKSFDVIYKGKKVSEFIPDIIVYDSIIIELKVIDKISDEQRGQVLNYLKVTKNRVAIILNFKNSKLEWERLVL